MVAGSMNVQGAEAVYPVVVAPDVLKTALPAFVSDRSFSRIAVISNSTIGPLYGEALVERIPDAFLITVPDGEQHKTLDTVRDMYGALLAGGANRSSLVIGLGGGVVGDMAGFAAATFMRGISFVQAPTSLLAMVDASIGGKVGVDLPQGKNLAGAFKDPLAVFADTSALATLPQAEFRSGLAEVIKAALVGDEGLLFHLLERGAESIDDVIRRAAAVKIALVERDRLEAGPRAFLNLGHTFGHALEHCSGYVWRHGEAVAWGMVAAARLSAALDLCDADLPAQVEMVVHTFGLPTRFSGYSSETLWNAMQHDKKWRGGATFVLLAGVGRPVIRHDVPRDLVLEVIEGLREDQREGLMGDA